MKGTPLLMTVLAAGITGCGLIRFTGEPTPDERLNLGVAALAQRDLPRAQEQLHWLYTNQWNKPVGRRAQLVAAAAELDPRHPDRRLWVGADMAARLLNPPAGETWLEPVAETLYLLSLELGANEERIARAEAARDSAAALPKLPGPSFLAQLQEVRAERDSLKRRSHSLEQALAAKEKELKDKEQELERIRKTLKG
ncbi:MAG: hypothetical protein ACREMQ_01420 [Longimicrobiales bacterium]